MEEAQRVLPLTSEVVSAVPETQALQLLTGKTRPDQTEAEVDRIMRESLPAFAQTRTRSLFGIDRLVPDKTLDLSDIPSTFRAAFRERTARWYVALTNGANYSAANARKEAPQRALEELRADWIITVHNDRTYTLPRFDNPADLEWTPDADIEWEALAAGLNLDVDLEDYRPTTRRGELGFVFQHLDDPLNVLTDDNGRVIHFRPETSREATAGSVEAQAMRADYQARVDALRVLRRKRNFMEWYVDNQAKQAAGRRYDTRINDVADHVTDANIQWLRQQKLPRGIKHPSGPGTEPPLFEIAPITYSDEDIDKMLTASTGP